MMDSKRLKLVAALLEKASEEFSNHGCNDLDDELIMGWTREELIQLDKEYHQWNGDPQEHNPEHLFFTDSGLMSFLAAQLMNELEQQIRTTYQKCSLKSKRL